MVLSRIANHLEGCLTVYRARFWQFWCREILRLPCLGDVRIPSKCGHPCPPLDARLTLIGSFPTAYSAILRKTGHRIM